MTIESNLWGVLVGAAVASIVPLVTLYQSGKRWRLEKRIENLRLKHLRLEKMYGEVFDKLPQAIASHLYPSTLTGQISVHASSEVRKLFFDHLEKKDRDESKRSHFFLDITLAANQHLAAIEKEIEDALA